MSIPKFVRKLIKKQPHKIHVSDKKQVFLTVAYCLCALAFASFLLLAIIDVMRPFSVIASIVFGGISLYLWILALDMALKK